MKISASKYKAKVFNSKRVVCLLPQEEDFRYHRVLFTSEGKLEHEIESESVQPLQLWVGHLYWTVMVKGELSHKVKLSIYWSVYAPTLTYGHEIWVKEKFVDTSSRDEFPQKVAGRSLRDEVRSSVVSSVLY